MGNGSNTHLFFVVEKRNKKCSDVGIRSESGTTVNGSTPMEANFVLKSNYQTKLVIEFFPIISSQSTVLPQCFRNNWNLISSYSVTR